MQHEKVPAGVLWSAAFSAAFFLIFPTADVIWNAAFSAAFFPFFPGGRPQKQKTKAAEIAALQSVG
jgi:hypothetical protein